MTTPFTGSYPPEDTVFLLKPMRLESVEVADKERLIQSGQRHYSEMLTPERVPEPRYLELFQALTERYAARLAAEMMALAHYLSTTRLQPITIVSLARAGTPIGALLARALRQLGSWDVRHYSISIIRDRGIDENALAFILRHDQRDPAGLVFVDGWTAKGVITEELRYALQRWNSHQPEQLESALHVVSDIGGTADIAATYDDYAIPSGILNATVSGLTSRSILNATIGPKDFHGCVFYAEFVPQDRSVWFLDQIAAQFSTVQAGVVRSNPDEQQERRQTMQALLSRLHHQYRIRDRHLIKPGVAEATRVLLRRVPGLLLLKDPAHPDVKHLQWLVAEKQVPVVIDPTLPIQAVALIKELS